MIPVIPAYISAILLVANLAIAVALWRILATGVTAAGLPTGTARNARLAIGAFLAAWLGGALLLAPRAASLADQDPFVLTPLIPLFNIVPLAIIAGAIWLSPTLRRVIAATPLPALIGIQFYRVIGAVFLVLLGLGQLPAHFALPAGWGDVAVGLAAPLVALAIARHASGARALAIGWNLFGLLDLVVAFGMGTGRLSPYLAPELGTRVPAAAAMGIFPLILVPTFAVPLSVALHLVALGRLRAEAVGSRLAAGAAR
jgi:hypothetical protein